MKTPLESRIANQAIKEPEETWREELLETAFSSQVRSSRASLSTIALPILWSVVISFIIATPDTSNATPDVAARLQNDEPLRLMAMSELIVRP